MKSFSTVCAGVLLITLSFARADTDVDASASENSLNSVEERQIGVLGYPVESEPAVAERQTPTNAAGVASLLMLMAAPVLFPLVAKASERSDTDPYLQWRREDTAERLFGPFNRGMEIVGNRLSKGTRRIGRIAQATRDNFPAMVRDTAKKARARNFQTIKRMGKATSNMMDAVTNHVQRARARNFRNIARMGSAVVGMAQGAARAARRIG